MKAILDFIAELFMGVPDDRLDYDEDPEFKNLLRVVKEKVKRSTKK